MCPGCLFNELRGLNLTFEVEMTYVVTLSMFLQYDFTVQFTCSLRLGRCPETFMSPMRHGYTLLVSFVIVSEVIFFLCDTC